MVLEINSNIYFHVYKILSVFFYFFYFKEEKFQEFNLQTMSDLKVEQDLNQEVETGKHVMVVIEKKIIGE